MKKYYTIGMMSGTSLDGIDLAWCLFEQTNDKYNFQILAAHTYAYNSEWKHKLSTAIYLNAFQFLLLHKEYGLYIATQINQFIKQYNCHTIHFISSHGHTTFHQPDKKLTFQIGCGATIAANTKITTISDFRTFDVALNGQGAPLVPIGDQLLFSQYDFCINIGGFSNISFFNNNKRIAYDICPANIIINELSQTIHLDYDKDGQLAKSGNINNQLLNQLNSLEYYQQIPPKSLGKEWLNDNIYPVLNKYNINLNDKLNTIYHHIAQQIALSTQSNTPKTILLTGGGTHNKFLIQLIKKYTNNHIIIPQNNIIDYKEALIFAFLGTLRYNNQINCLSSVTGSEINHSGGIIHLYPFPQNAEQ